MGTQQLLLIVLGVIIVGIAVVVGINIFGQNAEQAAKDAALQDCLRISATAQGFYRKPDMLGGGGNAFDGITLPNCGMSYDDGSTTTSTNANASYEITTATGDDFVVTATSIDGLKTLTVTVDMAAAEADRVVIDDTNWQ